MTELRQERHIISRVIESNLVSRENIHFLFFGLFYAWFFNEMVDQTTERACVKSKRLLFSFKAYYNINYIDFYVESK